MPNAAAERPLEEEEATVVTAAMARGRLKEIGVGPHKQSGLAPLEGLILIFVATRFRLLGSDPILIPGLAP